LTERPGARLLIRLEDSHGSTPVFVRRRGLAGRHRPRLGGGEVSRSGRLRGRRRHHHRRPARAGLGDADRARDLVEPRPPLVQGLDPVAGLSPGGCWCEQAADGRVSRYLETVLVEPGSKLVLQGGLGPLQGQGAAGGLTFTLQPEGDGTTLTWTYVVGGYATGGLEAWAAPVDGVLSAQLANLKTRVEAGD